MKKTIYAVAVLGAFANVANGQSSVTLYGVIDEGFEAIGNVKTAPGQGKALYQLDASSGLQGARWESQEREIYTRQVTARCAVKCL